MSLKFHSDPGHGWLEVPIADVRKSGAEISAFSYVDLRRKVAYLEEDCDAPAFAAKFGGFNGLVAQYGTIENVDHSDPCFIRNLSPWPGR